MMQRFALAVATAGVCACHGLLDVSDPTLIRDQDVANASGANGRRVVAYQAFHGSATYLAHEVALFTDEQSFDQPIQYATGSDELYLDTRDSHGIEFLHGGDDPHLGRLGSVITYSSLALPGIRRYTPDPLKGDYLAQLFSYRGYAILQAAEDICTGFPINDVTETQEQIYRPVYTTDSAVMLALTQLDSAIADVKDSTHYLYFSNVLKGRALLDLGRYDEAAAAVATVPDSFAYSTDPSYGNTFYYTDQGNDPAWTFQAYPIGDHEGGVGLDFLSEHDTVRIPTRYVRQGFNDTTIAEYTENKYPSDMPMVLASGTEARLIEAEVALHNNDPQWLVILNALRTPVGLAPLTDPGTPDLRVDLVYHERAFWLYLTGRRLGDQRRLIRNYGRASATLFPAGGNPFVPSAPYHNTTAIPFSFANESEFNPYVTAGCISQ